VIMVHIGLGGAVVFGGITKFTYPTYQPLIEFTNGHVWIWGFWITVSAMLMAAPFRWPNILGLWIGMIWHIIWMSCFTMATIRYETAAATPIPMFGGMALICTALLTARVIDKTKE